MSALTIDGRPFVEERGGKLVRVDREHELEIVVDRATSKDRFSFKPQLAFTELVADLTIELEHLFETSPLLRKRPLSFAMAARHIALLDAFIALRGVLVHWNVPRLIGVDLRFEFGFRGADGGDRCLMTRPTFVHGMQPGGRSAAIRKKVFNDRVAFAAAFTDSMRGAQ